MGTPYRFNRASGQFERRALDVPTATRRHGKGRRFFQMASQESFVGWDTQDVSADVTLHSQIVRLVARSRDLERNNDYIRKFLSLLKANVIGPTGLKFTACRKARNHKVDKTFNNALEKAWLQAGKLKHSPSTCGRMTRKDIADMVMVRLAVDGEALILHRPGWEGNKWRFGLQFIDAMRLDWRVNGILANGNRAKMGVEVNEDDRPIAYHILTQHPSDGLFGWHINKPEFERIPAERITHVFAMERPGQTRGVTWMAAPGLRARMLDKFEEAVVVGARVAASKMGFYKPTDEYEGDDVPGEEGNEGTLRQEVDPGIFEMLPRGIDLETFDANYPPANLEEFHKTMARGIASGLGANYNQIFSNYEGVNYSSLREAKLSDRDCWRTLQTFYIEHFEEPWLTRWATVQTLNEAAGLDPAKLEAMIADDCYRFTARGWQYVDPLKEVKANKEAVAAGWISPQRVIEETTGADPETILEEIAEFNDMAEKKGITLDLGLAPIPLAPEGDEDDPDKPKKKESDDD